MKLTVAQLIAQSNSAFSKKAPVDTLHQTLAEYFYPQRADFTITRNWGNELNDGNLDSYPILVRRNLGDSIGAMARDGEWFKMGTSGDPDHAGRAWLEQATKTQRYFMENRLSGFKRSTHQGDHDYATFGQCVISVEMSPLADGLLYRNWHLKECAWFDDDAGNVAGLYRKWEPTLLDLIRLYPENGKGNLHRDVRKEVHKSPDKKLKCFHICIPMAMYDESRAEQYKYVSLTVDTEHLMIIEEIPMNYFMYVVPRFQTVSGSPYAYSPATVIALPDARTLQAMTRTLLEAGERITRPPLVATSDSIRGDINLYADGVTYLDAEADKRTGGALRPLETNTGGFPVGLTMKDGIREAIDQAFYTNKIDLPDSGGDYTAYEFSERMKAYRRQNLPLFAPLESEYNGQLADVTFDLLMAHGMFGSPYDLPESLQGNQVKFDFISPLTEREEEKKATLHNMNAQMIATAMELDPAAGENYNWDRSIRDAIQGNGSPTEWLNPYESVLETRRINAEQQDQMEQNQLAAEEANTQIVQKQAEEMVNA